MTKKHYEAIAKILKHHRENGDICDMACYEIASGLAFEFAKENPRFDRQRFIKACGVSQL